LTPSGRRASREALLQRRQRLLERSQVQRAAVASAGIGAARRLRWLDIAWRAAVAVGKYPAILALPTLAWAWWTARRARCVAPPQSVGTGANARWPAPAAWPGRALPAAGQARRAQDTKGRR
jgi:hypothetical protein